MLGTIGEAERMEGTVIADAINLASRLEGLTKRYGASLLTSEYSLKKIKNPQDYNFRFLGKIRVKGKDKEISVFEIFDGDPEPVKELKLATKKDFEAGLLHYFAKKFVEAAGSFKKVLDANPDDKTARLYLERSAQFMVQGVPDDWQGVETMDSK